MPQIAEFCVFVSGDWRDCGADYFTLLLLLVVCDHINTTKQKQLFGIFGRTQHPTNK